MEQVYIGTTNYGRHWLDRPAADSWFRMVRDGCPPEGITDAGRTISEQEIAFRKYYTTDYASSAKFDKRIWNGLTWWRKPGMPSAATPGSATARHTFGRALDLNGSTKSWVRANGHRYGWIKDIVKNEDWHMEYQPNKDTVLVSNPGTSTGTPNIPGVDTSPIEPLEDDMTPEQDARLKGVEAAVAEIRRFIGVLGEALQPGTEGEARLVARIQTLDSMDDIVADVSETRRLSGVPLGWSEPVGPEVAARQKLWGETTNPS